MSSIVGEYGEYKIIGEHNSGQTVSVEIGDWHLVLYIIGLLVTVVMGLAMMVLLWCGMVQWW